MLDLVLSQYYLLQSMTHITTNIKDNSMKLYVIIVLDPDGPYVWSDDTCEGEANCTANEAYNETGYTTIVKCIEI
jgi:hypothetical protein